MEIRGGDKLKTHRRVAISIGLFLLLVLSATIFGMIVFSPQIAATHRNQPGLQPAEQNPETERAAVSRDLNEITMLDNLSAEDILTELRINESLNRLAELAEGDPDVIRRLILQRQSSTAEEKQESESSNDSGNSSTTVLQLDERLSALADELERILQDHRSTSPSNSTASTSNKVASAQNATEDTTANATENEANQNDSSWLNRVGSAIIDVWKLIWTIIWTRLQTLYDLLRNSITITEQT
jgi:hypothetical protein